ncbi:hypothetical protein RND71_044072 [Anisodus tanguticus]|uniref:transketolase n=1 Tax=Anisodus tanguticus TaxID=243964 RepID=A0AAE1UR88_9SOLA|nr:hypothetical protein RND71_044072 [Anisodus tanguticus]
MSSADEIKRLQDLANKLRVLSVQATDASKSGELSNLRKITSDLEGHPTPRLNFVDVATGSLGQGLSVAAGMAYVAKYIDQLDFRTYCVLGDGEVAEGSVWEAMNFASLKQLNNLVAIFDVNRLGQSQETCLGHQVEVYADRAKSFGWNPIIVDGHNISELLAAFAKAAECKDKPTAIIAKTFKGKGFPNIEDKLNWHGKALGAKSNEVLAHLNAQLSSEDVNSSYNESKAEAPAVNLKEVKLSSPPDYKLGEKIATRFAYGTALVKLGQTCNRVISLDAETKNSTYAETYMKQFPDRFVECYIAEQNLVGVGIGLGCRGRTIPFLSTFAAFFMRAADHLRMAEISQANIKCVGSHCGVSIGEDGPSQMALEDLALFRSIPNCTVFYPSDAVSTERACELAAQHHGIDFIRTSRPATSVIYTSDTKFEIGKAQVVRQSKKDKLLFIGAGVTLHECLTAADIIEKKHQIFTRVIDPFTIKPLDSQTIIENAIAVGGRVLVVEDHYPEGGLGDAVAKALLANGNGYPFRFLHLAVNEVPRSGQPAELMSKYRIDAETIEKEIEKFM